VRDDPPAGLGTKPVALLERWYRRNRLKDLIVKEIVTSCCDETRDETVQDK
jgi:hypothetical protein